MNLAHLIGTYGYFGLFVMLALEYVILVVPGETTLTTVGILSRTNVYHFHFLTLVLISALGTSTGALFAYTIGRLFGRPVIYKYGKYVFLTEKRLEQSETLFHRHTILTLLISKYIAVVRDIVPYIAGINRVPLVRFIPITLISSFLWTATFIGAGGFIGKLGAIVRNHWRTDIIPAVLVVVAAAIAYRMIHKKMRQLGVKREDTPDV
ncbi:DedA family protein [Alicyclobacillus fastidiosus]|uniref:DedA family protein n=1 Tax=Alicyclobacillus fastidiosus TaxID=392011 RepID=A0ABY6ZQ09_9BACL|nr:DedA family protein [Alicyclobacillus fastidiosus]WAH44186.1 DedA family protein [Alicyclobacillus fastidiosus]GMA60500.1 alkaline phosphatase [Alicyclobacillus fastidiosus]